MKSFIRPTTTIAIAASTFLTPLAFAGTPVPIDEIPEAVTKTLADYFPKSTIVSAEKETDAGREEYEVKIQYRDLRLEIELSADGKILDVDDD